MAGSNGTYNFSAEKEAFQRMLDKYGELVNNHRDIIDMFNEGISKFGKNAEDINKTIERSPALEKYYNELKNLVAQMAESRESMLQAVQKVTKKYSATTSDDVQKLFELERKLTQINKEVEKLEKKEAKGKLVKDEEIASYFDLLELQEKLNDEHSKMVNSSYELSEINKKMHKANTTEQKAYNEYNRQLKKSEDLTSQIKDNTANTANETERVAEAAGKASKKWENIANFAKVAAGIIKTAVKTNWEMENAAYKTAKAMGMNAAQAKAYHRFMLDNASELANTLGLPLEEITQFQNNFSKATGRAINMTNKQMKMYGSMTKLLGEDVTVGMIEEMDKLGNSLYESAEQAAKLISNVGVQGLNLSKTSAAFVKNMKLAHSFNFKRGVDGIQRMTLLSERLKFNLESIGSAAEILNSVEGSISTTANVQKLGGSFAMNFSDPMRLMYESWNDFEGLTERIVDTVKGKATFDRQTGEMQMGSLDRRFLQEFAKAINVPFEDIYQMATQQAKYQDMESSFQRGLSEEQRTAVGNRAQWNSTTGQYEVTYYDKNNKQVTRALSEIDSTIANTIMKGNDTEDAILGTTNNIYDTTKAIEQLIGRANNIRTDSEKARSLKEGYKSNLARGYEYSASDIVGDFLSWLNEFTIENPVISTVGGAAIGAGATLLSVNKIKDWYIKRQTRKNSPVSPSSTTTGGGGGGGANPQNGSLWSKLKDKGGKVLGKAKNAMKGKTGKALLAAGTIAALTALLTSATTDEQATEQIRLKQQKSADNASSSYYDENMSEVEKQTTLLEKIEKNTQGGWLRDSTNLTVASSSQMATQSRLSKDFGNSSSALSGVENGLAVASMFQLGVNKFSTTIGRVAPQFLRTGSLFTKAIPVLGTAVSIGSSAITAAKGLSDNKIKKSNLNQLLNSGQITKEEYVQMMKKNSSETNAAIGQLVGSAIGGIGGGVLGGPAGAATGAWLGSMGGEFVGSLTGDSAYDIIRDLQHGNRVNSYDYETSKFGTSALSGNNVAITAMHAQIKSSDILGSIYELLSQKFDSDKFKDDYKAKVKHDYGEKNWKIYDPFGWGENNDAWFSNGGIVKANNGIASIPGNSYHGDKVMARVNSGEMILNRNQQGALFKWIDSLSPSNIIKGISDYAKPTFIDKTKTFGGNNFNPSSNNSFNNSPTNINLNVNGTIKLDGGNGRTVDLRNLLDSPQFRKELVDIIIHQMSKNSNGGKMNYNSTSSKQGSFFATSI